MYIDMLLLVLALSLPCTVLSAVDAPKPKSSAPGLLAMTGAKVKSKGSHKAGGDAVYAMVGFKCDKWDSTSRFLKQSERHGPLPQPGDLQPMVMHGRVWNGQEIGYGYLYVVLRKVKHLKPTDKAVISGCIQKTYESPPGSRPGEITLMWPSGAPFSLGMTESVAHFYNNDNNYASQIRVQFGKAGSALPVMQFMRNNDKVLFGPNVHLPGLTVINWATDIASWPDTASYQMVLDKVVETRVLDVKFPDLDKASKQVKPWAVTRETFINRAGRPQVFQWDLTKTVSWTSTFSWKSNFGIKWTAGFKANVFFIGKAETSIEVQASFEVGGENGTTEEMSIGSMHQITVGAHKEGHAVATYNKGVITTKAILVYENRYQSGSIVRSQVTAQYEGVNVFDVLVKYSETKA